jgi:hypothetical protein
MKLYELAYCCRLYGQLTGYDRHLSQLHQRVGSGLDPSNPAHRTALFQWLNGWGCRQFARQHHATTASDSLVRWADAWLGRLPAWPVQLTDLSVPELELCAGAYDALRVLPASRRTLNPRFKGSSQRCRVGQSVASHRGPLRGFSNRGSCGVGC